MKHFTLLLRVIFSFCSILIISLSFHSSLLAQTSKKVTPGTVASVPAHSSTTRVSQAVTVTGLQQFYSSTGHYTLSSDGIGSLDASMNIRVNKPNAQATVQKAILISSVTNTTIDNGCVTISGVPVNWDGTASVAVSTSFSFNNYWADVTSIVASTINALPAGISTLPITECNTNAIEGEALLVVFNDPSAAEKTVIVMLGAENPQGDNFSVTLAKPIDPNASGALLDMGLGIGFSYEFNGVNQASQVSVNGQRVSSSAGGEDDGDDANGALLTVGGIGDANDNPADPFANPTNPRSDDELYSILPFITNSTTSLTINTINPSLDDNIFLAYFVTSGAAIVGEGILLAQTSDTGNVGDSHTVTATVVNSLGQAVTDRPVTFTITSGPNAGNTFTTTSDASGNASYTYTGTGGVGTDSIEACFTNSQSETSCSNVLSFTWISGNGDCDPNYKVHIGVIPKYTVKGQDEHTIYIGYGPQSVALLAAHNGGTGPYTYSWSDGATSHIHVVSPDVTTTYSVTITDAHGCSSMCSVTIYVVDVRCSTTLGNIYVCNGGQTMSVAKADVPGWLDKGAKLGQCTIVPLTAANKTVSLGMKPVTMQTASAFSIYPNPAVSSVTLKWNTVLTGNAKVVITDLQGRILMTQSVSGSSKTITISQLAGGVYMAKLVTSDKTVATSRFIVSK